MLLTSRLLVQVQSLEPFFIFLIFIYMKNIILFLTMAVIVLTGCKPKYPESPKYTIISGDDIRKFIVETNHVNAGDCTMMVDNSYAVPTIEWIKKDYTPIFKQFLFDNQLNSYEGGKNECDKFSYYGVTVGHMMHFHSNSPANTGLSIGEFTYMVTLTPHDIMFFVATDESGKLKLVFYEPQAQQIFELDPADVGVLGWRM